jgi:fluoroacetyl-CoA thioesterase
LQFRLRSRYKKYVMDLTPGATAEVSTTVSPDRTADAMGNRGVQVLATPFVIGLLEDAAGAVLKPHLPPGAATVGTMVEMRHLAATPVGMRVRATATLLETDGRRYLFSVEAWDEKEKIAEGRHERFVVPDLQKFLARAMKKGER